MINWVLFVQIEVLSFISAIIDRRTNALFDTYRCFNNSNKWLDTYPLWPLVIKPVDTDFDQ